MALLADELRAGGHPVVATREPGGTPVAERVRAVLLDPALAPVPLADALLHFAARADHVAAVIRAALQRGENVLCDRFSDSTRAYQGFGQGFDRAAIETLHGLIGLDPDLTIVLDIRVSTSLGRADGLDRYERLGTDFLDRVHAGFRAIAAAEPVRCALIAADRDRDAIAADVRAVVRDRLGL